MESWTLFLIISRNINWTLWRWQKRGCLVRIVRTNTLLINVSLTDIPFIIHLAHLVGEGLLVSNAIKVIFKRINVSPLITSFELMEAVLTICSVSLRLIVIYRMPPSKINGLKTGTFYEEFSE